MAHSIVSYVENGDSLSEYYPNKYNRSDYIRAETCSAL